MSLKFATSDSPSLGVELELQLVDAESYALKNCILEVLEKIPEDQRERIKPELMQSYLEINTDVCQTVNEVGKDLRQRIKVVKEAAAKCDCRLFWGGTHPFSKWFEQKVTPNDRYYRLVENLEDTARRLVTFGLHVHVGVDTGDKAVMICDRILRHLPTFLALSSNSPFWNNRKTGLHSQRSKVMEGLPTAGLPPLMRNWSEYVWLIKHLVDTNFIETIREIWWDVRPHHNFGTVEVRICDMPPDLDSVLAITAMVQCLVKGLSDQIDEGTYLYDCHPMMVRQNKWRACRYGIEAVLVDPYTQQAQPARELVLHLVDLLKDHGKELSCLDYLEHAHEMVYKPSGAQRQLEIFEKTGNTVEVVRQLLGDE